MLLTYSRFSRPTALAIAQENDHIRPVHGSVGSINWGKRVANTKLNSDISNSTNKRVMRELFKANGVPMPQLLDNGDIGHRLFRGETVLGRPDRHTKGRGFWKCNSLEQVRKAYRGTSRKQAATHFMEFIDAPREYRVHIFMGKSIRISEKAFGTTGETAHGLYTTAKPTHNVKHVRKAAKQAVKALGLDFGAVDILANDTECWVTEVNAAPGLGGSMPALYAEMFSRWEMGEFE